jgi:hypothetical protein
VGQDATVDAEAKRATVDGPPGDGSGSSHGWRARVRRTRAGALCLKSAVFVLGLFFVLLGVALAALPGPLTIPPILLGVWIWSSEFGWADRLFERARRAAREAWEKARRQPVVSALTTLSGLLVLGGALYLVYRYQLVERAREVLGL